MTASPPPPPGRKGLAEDLSTCLAGLHRTVRRHVRTRLHLEPLAGAQGDLLRLVVERPGISVSAAAKELRLAGNSVSTQVQQLSRLGYLSRETSPTDRRGAVLRATPAGEERLSRWADERAELFERQLNRLGEEDLAALAAALPALRALMDAVSTDPGAPAAQQPSLLQQPPSQQASQQPQDHQEPQPGSASDR